MNVLICLKSRIIGEALLKFLDKKGNGAHYFLSSAEYCSSDCDADVIVVDRASMSRGLFAQWPGSKIILLDTGLEREEVISLILSYKLHGVFSAEADSNLICKALKLVHEGQIWIDNDNLKMLLHKAETIYRNDKTEHISKREQEVLTLISQGKKNKEIAAQLFISEQTVKAHISHIFKKYNVSNRTHLISRITQPTNLP